MSQCNYQRLPDGRWMCIRCMRVSKSTPKKAPRGTCSVRGLGDYLKSALEMCGLTRARWTAIQQWIGAKTKTCGCHERQEKVNRWGDSIRRSLSRACGFFSQMMTQAEPLDDTGLARHQCSTCGHITAPIFPSSADKVYCRCQRAKMGFPQKVANFARAAVDHVRGGLKIVDDDTRAARLAICHGCELYDGQICTHHKCGCGIKSNRSFIDKLSWATSKCPIDKWSAVPPQAKKSKE